MRINLVMFHSGLKLPEFLECAFRQIRLFNPEVMVYFITDKVSLNDLLFKKYEIISLNKDLFYSNKIKKFEELYNWSSDHFWAITTTRLIYIENLIERLGLTNVYYFENDVLLYYDLKDHHEKFQKLYKHMAITPGGQDKNMTGFMFIKNWKSLFMMTQFFIDILKMHGLKKLREKYKTGMIHEMSLMKIYEMEKGLKYLNYLPILPFGEHASEYGTFNSIFDPASWGQFVGGTQNEGPGAKPEDHYIGQLLISNPDYTVVWKKDNKDRRIPYFKYDGNEIKINNLHIHSKNLSKYMS